MKTLTFVAPLALALLAAAPTPAQEKQTPPAPSGLAVELKVGDAERASYHSVPSDEWGGSFRPLWGAKVPYDFLVRMKTETEGDGVRVRIAASRDNFRETEIPVATRLLHVGESATVSEELAQVSFQPVELRVLRVNRAGVAPLRATSALRSVAVVGVEALKTNFPSYKVTLKNVSGKDIVFVGFSDVRPDGRRLPAQWASDPLNRPLMKPGETYAETFKSDRKGTATGDSFTLSAPEPVEVAAVVFSDYSYEGNATSVSHFITLTRGRRAQLVRTAALLRQPEAVESTGGLYARNMALYPTFTDADLAELSRQFPVVVASLDRNALWGGYTRGMQDVNWELARDIRAFEAASRKGGKTLSAWVAELREKYDAWLARL